MVGSSCSSCSSCSSSSCSCSSACSSSSCSSCPCSPCPGWSRTSMVVFTMDRSFCPPLSPPGGTPSASASWPTSGTNCVDELLFTNVFSRDLAPTETVDALEVALFSEPASLTFRLVVETSELFWDMELFFVAVSVSLEAFLVLFLFVTLTEEVVLISFCSVDSFLVLPPCFVRLAVEDVLNTCCSLPLVLRLEAA